IYQHGAPSNNVGISLAAALDTEGALEWSTIGEPAWFGQTIVSRDGADAAQSGQVGDSGAVTAVTTVNGPGTVFFWWKVSSETNKDYLKFYLGGSLQESISGEVDWIWRSWTVASGSQVIQWSYVKDSSGSAGQDSGWVDQIHYVPNNTPT